MSGFINFLKKKKNSDEKILTQAWEYYIKKEEDEQLREELHLKARRTKKEKDDKEKQEEMDALSEYQKYRNIIDNAPENNDYDYWYKLGINQGVAEVIKGLDPCVKISFIILKFFSCKKPQVLDVSHSDKALYIFAEYQKLIKDCYVPKVDILTVPNSTIYKIVGTLQSEYVDIPTEIYYSDMTKEWYRPYQPYINNTVYDGLNHITAYKKDPDNLFEICGDDYFQNTQRESLGDVYNEQRAFAQEILRNIDDKKVCGRLVERMIGSLFRFSSDKSLNNFLDFVADEAFRNLKIRLDKHIKFDESSLWYDGSLHWCNNGTCWRYVDFKTKKNSSKFNVKGRLYYDNIYDIWYVGYKDPSDIDTIMDLFEDTKFIIPFYDKDVW